MFAIKNRDAGQFFDIQPRELKNDDVKVNLALLKQITS